MSPFGAFLVVRRFLDHCYTSYRISVRDCNDYIPQKRDALQLLLFIQLLW